MEQTDILRHAIDTLEQLGVPYLIDGSFASIAYGESRFTQDIELGYLDIWQKIVAKVDAPDQPPGPGVP